MSRAASPISVIRREASNDRPLAVQLRRCATSLAFDARGSAEGGKLASAIDTLTAYVVSLFCLAAIGCSRQAGAIQVAAAPSESQQVVTSTGAAQRGITPRVQILPVASNPWENISVQRVDLGTVQQGESVRRTFIVENRTSQPITIDRFEPSCECLSIGGVPLTIAPASETLLELRFDGSRDVRFRGTLGIEVTAFARLNTPLRFEALITIGSTRNAAEHRLFLGAGTWTARPSARLSQNCQML
jgi:hypothetical protein